MSSSNFFNNAFVTRLTETNGEREWARLVRTDAGMPYIEANAVAADAASGDIFVTGSTLGVAESSGASNLGSLDAWVARLPAAGGAPLWMQQIGASGSSSEIARAVAVGSGGVFVAGETNGELDPDGVAGGMDAFVVKLDAGNGAIVWQRQLGSDGTDEAMAIAVAPGGDLYLAGRTAGAIGTAAFDAPSPPPPPMACRNFCLDGSLPVSYRCTSQAKFCEGCTICGGGGGGDGDGGGGDQGGEDAWVAKVEHDGTVGWIVQFGSGGDDAARAVTADDSRVAVAGSTAGALTPRSRHQGGVDAFVVSLDPASGAVDWATQFGSDEDDEANAIAAAPDGTLYAAGSTRGALDGENRGSLDGWFAAVTG